jgi:WD40 repeat protein
MHEAELAMLEVDEETTQLELVLSKQVNAPLADGTDVTKRVPDDVLELVLRKLTIAELFQAGRVSRRWRLLVGRVSQMWSAMDVRFAKYNWCALEPRVLSSHTLPVHALVVSADGQRLYSGSEDRTVVVWSTAGGAPLQTLQGHTGTVWALAVSANGQQLYSGSQDNTVRVWSSADGAPLLTLRGHTATVRALVLSADGQRLYSGSEDSTVRVWSTAGGVLLQTLQGHTEYVWALAVSADGQRLYSGSSDCTVRVWSTADGAPLQTLETHTRPELALVVSADGQRLYSGSHNRTVRMCSTAAGAPSLRVHPGIHVVPLQTLLFSGTRTGLMPWRCRRTASGCTLDRGTAQCACGRRRTVRRCRGCTPTCTALVRWRCQRTASSCTLVGANIQAKYACGEEYAHKLAEPIFCHVGSSDLILDISEHQMLLTTAMNLGCVLTAQGQHAAAVAMHRGTLTA